MAGPDDYRKRIEEINRGPLRNRPDPAVDVEALRRKIRDAETAAAPPRPEPILYRRDLPRSQAVPPASSSLPTKLVRLEEVVQGVEVLAPCGGKALVVSRTLEEERQRLARLSQWFRDSILDDDSGLSQRFRRLCGEELPDLEQVVLFDIETTGLSSSPMFLIGFLTWRDGGLAACQLLARDYSEERAIASLFAEVMGTKRLLVSFNGKSFDWPYVRTRAAANAVPFPEEPPHLDLLHEARRVWSHRVPDCRLQTLEQFICGRSRQGDIPGSEIPDAYHAFVRTGSAAQMAQIIRHNRLDLMTLAELLLRLPGSASAPPRSVPI